MAQQDDKRLYRKLKRMVKRAGNRQRRQQLKRDLLADPKEADNTEFDYGKNCSASMNGIDRDATRKRVQEEE
jgi:hypothetical protein